VIVVDSNILMYGAGSEHRHRAPSLALLERIAADEVEAITNTEVLQEILHRYRSIGRWEDGRRVYDLTRRILVTILPISVEVMDEARSLMDERPGLGARDAVHAAFTRSCGASAICSYDRGFDGVPGLLRLEPPQVK
jgi:predicted nucleic acid-binding protein